MKALNYGLIVSDFDGTLAGGDSTVSEKNKKAIFEYIDAGGIFAVSSGRLPAAILPVVRKMGLKGLISCAQGAIIMDIESGEILLENRLSLETTLEVCRKMEEMGLHILAFDLFDYYSNRDDGILKLYENVTKTKGKTVTDCKLSDFLEEKKLAVYKLIVLVAPDDNKRILESLKNADFEGCDITKSIDFLVEAVSKTNSKGTALSFLAQKYRVPIEKTIAIGDNFNDLSMIECAGLGVAVANAEDALKSAAGYICEYTNDESAVADIIERFGFKLADNK